MSEEKKKPSISEKIGSSLATLACVMAVLLCLLIVAQVYTQGYVKIAGFSVFRVVTGSMEPNIPVGSLLLSQQTPISEIEKEDIVCFVSKEPPTKGKIITHRVVSVTKQADETILLETQGDANLIADRYYVTSENLIGKVAWHTKEGNLMAALMGFLTNKVGFLICVLVPILLVAGFILKNCVQNIRKEMDVVLQEVEKEERISGGGLLTQEEYAEMEERIRQECLEEIKQGVQKNDGRESPEKTE
ncbi:MAG: signal peptidase I [Ruminococcaceae bacterium]|nr:signal peptidase I [Oscillospiraceae bacterium]